MKICKNNFVKNALLLGFSGAGVFCVISALLFSYANKPDAAHKKNIPESNYGTFLSMQHAVYADDYGAAQQFARALENKGAGLIQTDAATALFLSGVSDDSAKTLVKDESFAGKMAYAAHLVKNDKWAELQAVYKNTKSPALAPFRIWSSVAVGKSADALKFVNSGILDANLAAFYRGQIYAHQGKNDAARTEFQKLPLDFINLGDFAYILSFYKHAGMDQDLEQLYADYTARAPSAFLINIDIPGVFDDFSNAQAQLAFSAMQGVSHARNFSGVMILPLLRFAEITANSPYLIESANYYLGIYFSESNNALFNRHAASIATGSMFAPFMDLRRADAMVNGTHQIRAYESILDAHPMFVLAIDHYVSISVQAGRKSDALRALDAALANDMFDTDRAAFLTRRANINRIFGNFDAAGDDIIHARDLSPDNPGILSEQLKLWAATNKNIEQGKQIATMLVKKNPIEPANWDALAQFVLKSEGLAAALEILVPVAEITRTNSEMFYNLGQMLERAGNTDAARAAYEKSRRLSGDGLVPEKIIAKKLKNLAKPR